MSHKHHDHVLTVTTTLPPQQQYQLQLSQVQRLQQENANLQHQLRLQQQQLQISSPSPSKESRPPLSPSPNRSSPDEEVRKSRVEVERLQDLVLVMGRKHLQAQAQLAFLQQQTQWPATPTSTPGSPFGPQTPTPMSPFGSIQGGPRSAALVPDLSQASLLASIAAVAGTTLNATREKPHRRFTLQTKNLKEDELTVEQRKCEFLMDQIANLQRGYDALRQEKSTLEIQLDLMHRQHQYHQQQRQKRRSSQRRTLGHDQTAALSLALSGLPQGGSRASRHGEYNPLSGIPATPPMSATSSFFSTPEAQAQEVARIQYELTQAQLREEEEERRVHEQRRAAEKAEQEARRLRRQKSMHLKEALASLESKRNRSDNGLGQFSSSEDLKHLEQLQLFSPLQQSPGKSLQAQLSLQESGQQQQQQQQHHHQQQQLPPKSPPPRLQLSPVGLTFQNAAAAAAAAGRKILSPFSPRVESEPRRISSSASSDTAPRSPRLSTAASSPALTTTSSASSSPPTSVSSSFSSSTQSTKQQAAPYTQRVENSETPLKTRRARPSPSHTYDIEQCSCCIGVMIEL
ncbi:hypothetical protein EMPS_06708 [Entomortierella parvispora]|uniref:Uncharacterized protein n=1 Tax=Entomortierella parvispora TaxID=205924 RepID=A0A9P3LXZ5_9FUNG|nr:hypothetical protein EMPS_06708 [Entomortierella parvispora]